MKIIIALYSFCFIFYLRLKNIHSIVKTKFFATYIRGVKNNFVKSNNSQIYKTKIYIKGKGNIINFDSSKVSDTLINIKGLNNTIKLDKGVELRKAIIIIRGSNCKIIIGKSTTFGQVRMINVGKNNDIVIGERCLFADNIEIWASDTHSIYDENGYLINNEKSINIGNDVWMGAYVKVLKGVTVNDGAIIGMNSMVTKNIDANTLNVGIPTKCIKKNIKWSLAYDNEKY